MPLTVVEKLNEEIILKNRHTVSEFIHCNPQIKTFRIRIQDKALCLFTLEFDNTTKKIKTTLYYIVTLIVKKNI